MKSSNFVNKIKENFKKNKVLLFVFLLIWVAVVTTTIYKYENTLGKSSVGNRVFQNVEDLYEGVEIEQRIKVKEIEDAKTICIKFATFARNGNKGEVYIKVVGSDSKKEYANKTINISNIDDNDYYTLKLNETLLSEKDNEITINISSNSKKGENVGIYYSDIKAFENSQLKINNIEKDGDLSVRFLIDNDDLNKFYKIMIIWVISTFTIIILLILLNVKYENLFLAIAIILGITYLFIITPMSVPDETVHYEYSFQLSNKIMGKKDYLLFDEEYQNYGSFVGHYNVSDAYIRLINKFNKPLSLDNSYIEMAHDIEESYTIPFIPQALGITLARLLSLNMLKTFYLGRLFNLAFYVCCVYIAIKKTPIHKILFGIIATLPIFMQQAASYSYDCYVNGLVLVLLSFILKWMYQEKTIENKELILVLVINFLIAPVKVIYGLFSFLFCFIPVEKFGDKRKKKIGILILTLPVIFQIITILSPLVFRVFRRIYEYITDTANIFKSNLIFAETADNGYEYAESIENVKKYNFTKVLDDPLGAIEIIARTIRYNIKPWFYAAFGRMLSGSTLVVPIDLIHLLLVVVIIASIRKESYVESVKFKTVSFIICIVAGLMMLAGLLITWTPLDQEIIAAYGGPIIQGVQGRYFSPLLPAFFILFNNKKIRVPEKFDKYLLFIYVMLSFEIIVYILSYTFVN